VESSDYSEAEKYIFLGLLLKKKRPENLDKRVLGIIRSEESLERKIQKLLDLDEIHKRAKDDRVERPKHEEKIGRPRRRGRRKKKPRVNVIDPSGDIYGLLQSSLLRKRVFFRRSRVDDIELINESKPDLLIINQTHSLRKFTLEINQLLKPSIPLIVLSSERSEDLFEDSTKRLFRCVKKPLNVAYFEQTIRELIG
jgi:hypothetical protein